MYPVVRMTVSFPIGISAHSPISEQSRAGIRREGHVLQAGPRCGFPQCSLSQSLAESGVTRPNCAGSGIESYSRCLGLRRLAAAASRGHRAYLRALPVGRQISPAVKKTENIHCPPNIPPLTWNLRPIFRRTVSRALRDSVIREFRYSLIVLVHMTALPDS